jgi:hypothetical protein
MKIIETKDGVKGIAVNLRTRVEVTTTEKHPVGAGKKRQVPEHMVGHLLKKGMIEDPAKKVK